MQVINISPQVTAFYYGADAEQPASGYRQADSENDWVYGACFSLGVACYAIHNKKSCIVFDTLCSPEQANEIKTFLESTLGVNKFTVVVSHWHLHHIGGNELYKDFNIVGTRKTRNSLTSQKADIEAGSSSWGPPAIAKVRPPDIVFDSELSIFLDDLEVRLCGLNIHSEDSLYAYLPEHKILLAGDMLEDPIPFVTDPGSIPAQLKNYDPLRALDIERILPNHCRLATLRRGGSSRELIESTAFYLESLDMALSRDPEAVLPDVNSLMRHYLDNGVIGYWPPYERVHRSNIEKVKAFYKAAP